MHQLLKPQDQKLQHLLKDHFSKPFQDHPKEQWPPFLLVVWCQVLKISSWKMIHFLNLCYLYCLMTSTWWYRFWTNTTTTVKGTNIGHLDTPNTTPRVRATNTWDQDNSNYLNKFKVFHDLQLLRDLVGQVRVYGGILHLQSIQILCVPVIMVDAPRLFETR